MSAQWVQTNVKDEHHPKSEAHPVHRRGEQSGDVGQQRQGVILPDAFHTLSIGHWRTKYD